MHGDSDRARLVSKLALSLLEDALCPKRSWKLVDAIPLENTKESGESFSFYSRIRKIHKPQHNSTLHALSSLTLSLWVRLLQPIVPPPSLADVAGSLSWRVVLRWMPTPLPIIGWSSILAPSSAIRCLVASTIFCRSACVSVRTSECTVGRLSAHVLVPGFGLGTFYTRRPGP